MTRSDIELLVARWTIRLGLRHWEVTVDWEHPPPEGDDANAWTSHAYDQARLTFSPEFETWTPESAERTVVHELLHLVTRELDTTVGMALELLPAHARKLAEKHLEREVESLVERLATSLVAVAAR